MNYEEILKKYVMVYDHHTHTTYSHGTGSIMDNVRIAHEKGLESIAITDHGPGNFLYGMKMDKVPEMRRDIAEAMEAYPDVKVLLGVEANTLLKAPYVDLKDEDWGKLDIVLAGYHFAVMHAGMVENRMGIKSRKLLLRNTDMIVNAIYHSETRGHHIEVVTHPGDKGPFDIDEIARACEDTGTLMEINVKHPHLSVEEIKTAMKHDVKFIISSDAHVPENVGTFEPQLLRALQAGLDPERIVNIRLRQGE